jgi:hypothetical protein
MDVTNVVLEYRIFDTSRGYIIFAQVDALNGIDKVCRITIIPFTILGCFMIRYKINVPVTEFCQHFGQDLEKFLVGHVIGQTIAVLTVGLVPIEAVFLILIIEEAILGVDDVPKCLEVSFWIVLGNVLGDAGWEKEGQGE